MSTSETINELATALAAAQAAMTNAPLNKVNPHYKNKYADLAAIRDATLPVLNKHGLALIQTTEISDAGAVLVTRLAHKSGQWIEGVYPLPLQADKPQIMGSALTYARRYAWAAICGITADEDDDAETASKPKTNGNGVRPVESSGPISADQLKTLRVGIIEAGADEAKFAEYLKVPDLARLPASQFQRALEALDAKRARQ